ncbi:hypothetical protein ACFL0E_00490 [Nanoarchaeota archaeon]
MAEKELRQIKKSSKRTFNKELPGYTLEESGHPGMKLYNGHIEGDLRFRTYVPTTIFDPKVAILRVYRLEDASHQYPKVPEEVVARETVPLESMPYWDVGAQAVMLSGQDHESVVKACKTLEKKLLPD